VKLSDFQVGDTVILKGASAPDRPLFVGDILEDGRTLLWTSKAERLAGGPWSVSAAGSHEAVKGEAK